MTRQRISFGEIKSSSILEYSSNTTKKPEILYLKKIQRELKGIAKKKRKLQQYRKQGICINEEVANINPITTFRSLLA